jgi:prefoldin beta subunit
MEKADSNLLGQAQLYSQQIQLIVTQKTALLMELNEIKKALEEMGKTEEKFVYKLSGPILIRVETAEMKQDLREKEGMINLRVKTLEKQEIRVKERIDELRTKIIKVRPEKATEKEEE